MKKRISKTVQPGFSPPLSYEVGNLQGLGKRTGQEDSFAMANATDMNVAMHQGLFILVCDGMGGMMDGRWASDTSVNVIRNHFRSMDIKGDISAQMEEALLLASSEVENNLHGDGGSTAVSCVLYDDKLNFASVGDSFIFLKRNEHLYRLNREHTMCTEIYLKCIREGIIDSTEGRNDVQSTALTGFLGRPGLCEIDRTYTPIRLNSGDVIMICSDGVGGVLDDETIWRDLSLPSVGEICSSIENDIVLKDEANQDNYTAIVVKVV